MQGSQWSPINSLVFWFATIGLLLPSGCDGGHRSTVAPSGTPVDKERFSDAKLTFKNEVVKDGRLVLEKGKEYEYSGSFQIAQIDDETDESISIERIRSTLILKFIIDGEKSGTGPDPQGKPVREIITGGGSVSDSWIDASNILHFEGKLKAPKNLGEHELRLGFLPEGAQERIYILTRLVQVVGPKAPNGT